MYPVSAHEGVLVLGESALRFTLDGDALVADQQEWKRGAAGGTPVSAVLSPTMPSVMRRLVANPWRKSNDFDLERIAETLRFAADGTFEATYRSGTCAHAGTYSINSGELHAIAADNHCQPGGGTARVGASNESPRFDGEMLVFYASSYVPEGTTGPRRFVHDSYGSGDGIRMRGEYDGAPAVGKPLAIRVRLENPMRDPLLLTKLSAEYGKAQLPLAGALPGDSIAPGGAAEVTVTLTPISGATPLRIIAEAKGRTQDWRSWWSATLTLP